MLDANVLFAAAIWPRWPYEVVQHAIRGDFQVVLPALVIETDVPLALAAINTRVDYLVSEDKDLTARDASTEALRARIKVLLCGTFLREVMGWDTSALEQARRRTWRDLSPPAS